MKKIKGRWQDNINEFTDVSLCLTDPPYGMGLAKWDKLDLDWLEIAYKLGKDDLMVISFMAAKNYDLLASKAREVGFIIHDPIAYLTPSSYGSSAGLRRRMDLIMVASKNTLKVDSTKEEVGIIGDGKPEFPSQDYKDSNTKMKFKRGNPSKRTEWRHAGTAVATESISPDYDKYVLIKKSREKDQHFAKKNILLAEWLVNLFGINGIGSRSPCGQFCFTASNGKFWHDSHRNRRKLMTTLKSLNTYITKKLHPTCFRHFINVNNQYNEWSDHNSFQASNNFVKITISDSDFDSNSELISITKVLKLEYLKQASNEDIYQILLDQIKIDTHTRLKEIKELGIAL
jgi:hypothetical protein